MNEVNLVIESHAGNLVSGRKFVEIAENFHLHGLHFIYLGEHELSSNIVQYGFRALDGDGKITLTDDYDNDLEYITISGMPRTTTDKLTNLFKSNFYIRNLDEIKELLESDLESNSRYLIHLGLTEVHNSRDEKTIAILQEALFSKNSRTALRAITAISLINLEILSDNIKILAETSNNQQIREAAGLAFCQMKSRLP